MLKFRNRLGISLIAIVVLIGLNGNAIKHQPIRGYIVDKKTVALDTLLQGDILEPLTITTRRDIKPFISAFTERFGKNYEFESSYIDCYTWKNISDLGRIKLEIRLWIDKNKDNYEIRLNFYDPVNSIINEDLTIRKFLNDLIIAKLKTQSVEFSELPNNEIEFKFDEIVETNYDSLLTLIHHLAPNEKEIEIKIDVNSESEVSKIECGSNLKITALVKNVLKSQLLPIVVSGEKKDTVAYSIFWNIRQEGNSVSEIVKKVSEPQILELLENDTVITDAFFTDDWYTDCVKDVFLLGNLFNTNRNYLIIHESESNFVYFYRFTNAHYELIEKMNSNNYDYFELCNLDGDSTNEIVFSTVSNMNGNTWKEVYKFDAVTERLKLSGNFCCYWEVNHQKKELYESHYGSWYMPVTHTIYQWREDKLIRKKFIQFSLKDADMDKEAVDITTYYENPYFDTGLDTLVLKYKGWAESPESKKLENQIKSEMGIDE